MQNRRWLHLSAAISLGALIAAAACVRDRATFCDFNSDCESSVCTNDGICGAECHSSSDCQSGAFCAPACGLCITVDGKGPSTCVPYQMGLLTVEAVRGACGLDSVNNSAANDGSSDGEAAVPVDGGSEVSSSSGSAVAAVRTPESCAADASPAPNVDGAAAESEPAPADGSVDAADEATLPDAEASEGGDT